MVADDCVRRELETLSSNLELHSTTSTAIESRIYDSIVQQRDVFETALHDQTTLILSSFDEAKRKIEEHHEVACGEFKQISEELTSNHVEHDQIVQEIRAEGSRSAEQSKESGRITLQQVQSSELEILDRLNSTSELNQTQHLETRVQIAQLQQAIQDLSAQMEMRTRELKEVLAKFQSTSDKTAKKQLQERSKLVTVALLALETMYRNLKVCRILP